MFYFVSVELVDGSIVARTIEAKSQGEAMRKAVDRLILDAEKAEDLPLEDNIEVQELPRLAGLPRKEA